MSQPSISRRRLLGTAAATAAFTIVPRHALGGAQHTAPSEKLNIAGIGVGGMGKSNLSQLETENIVALCDVDHAYAAGTFKKYPQAKVYTDYREMLDKQKDIDAVMIATPDHTHAVISMAAMRPGKHVYCQKPLTHDVYEARMLAKAARETGVTTQMGIQGHSMEGIRLICEWICRRRHRRSPRGRCLVQSVLLSLGPRLLEFQMESPAGRQPAGAGDAQLGPVARPRPASGRIIRPTIRRVWRCWWDFGCGMMGDRGAHTLDPVVWALKLGQPTSIEATSLDSIPTSIRSPRS